MDSDVVVVGAGLAGLACASELERAGLEVVVLEAAEEVGGRIRTDHVDGFLVDRGFQLLNPAYPELTRHVDVAALGLQPFGAGVVAVSDEGRLRLGHPLREPRLLGPSAVAAARRPRTALGLARWLRPLLARDGHRLLTSLTDRGLTSRREGLDRAGVEGTLRRVVDRFLDGVLLEDDGSSAEAFALLLTRSFARGVPALPREGMQALPEQVASRLAGVRLSTPVRSVSPHVVHTDDGALRAWAVVVATDGAGAGALLGIDAPRTKGVVTTWWACDQGAPRRDGDLLHVDARRRPSGPVVNCAVVSEAAPSYAPPGRRLVQASALIGPHGAPAETAVRNHAAELLGRDAAAWQVLARHEVPHALPAQPAPFVARRPVALGEDLFVCGDHRDTASIQGALVSGRRTASAVVEALGGGRTGVGRA